MNPIEDRTLTIERTFNAPIALVWEAWTQPEHIVHWWGPKGMNTKVLAHNFVVGGSWKYAMLMPDGQEFITEGRYLEIEYQKRIVSTADFKPMTEGVELHILLEAAGDATHFTFKVVHATSDYCRQQEAMGFYNGWGSTFNRLEEYLSTS
ncbi:MAG: SRPBCC domain-containing protein [Phaeodactylibacter sp.]|nr:SRPBCC domain-containing protein [Phaeodactylibacter sp.]